MGGGQDLWISKAVAGRAKDREFCRAMVEHDLVDASTLKARLRKVRGLSADVRTSVAAAIERGAGQGDLL